MQQAQLSWITNFIWGIADDVLRNLYVLGKYRDVILPITVLRLLDAVLKPTKQAVPDIVKTGYEISFTRYFYNPQTLRFLKDIRADILALERETDGLLTEILGGSKH